MLGQGRIACSFPEPGFFASLYNDTRLELTGKERTATWLTLILSRGTLTYRPRCGLLSRKIRRGLESESTSSNKPSNGDEVPHLFLILRCKGYPCRRKCETHRGFHI